MCQLVFLCAIIIIFVQNSNHINFNSMKSKKQFLFLCMAAALVNPLFAAHEVTELRTLGLDTPMGIESNPTFSWKFTSDERSVIQGAYEITVTGPDGEVVWNSGKVESRIQTDVPYEGGALQSMTKYDWALVVYNQHGDASETATSSFETGLLEQAEWEGADWIAMKTSPYKAVVEILPEAGNVKSQYVRINVTASGPHAASDPNYGFVQIAEIEIYNEEGENIAPKAKFSATNAWELDSYGWSINYINDGVISGGNSNGFTTTQNCTSTDIVADLGSVREISRIVLYPRQDDPALGDASKVANFPSSYTIETGVTPSEYTLFYQVENAEAPSYQNNNNVPYFGRNFDVASGKSVVSARLYASALGVFTMKLNGSKVTENVLEPGETAYDKHVLYSTYDVTPLLVQGKNTLIAQVAGGIANMSRMSDRFVKPELANNAATTSLRAILRITYADGSVEQVCTDADWRTHKSPTTGSNWYGGEDYDARLEISGIGKAGFDVSGWEKCEIVTPVFCSPHVSSANLAIGQMRAREYEPLRVVETWKAVSVVQNKAGNYLVDFGQNFAGTYSFTLKEPAGTVITLYDSELQENDACKFEYMYEPAGASNKTLDTYIFRGDADGETWGPEFMYHGFRYLEISGLTKAPQPGDFVAKRIRCDVKTVGHFETSNTLLNDIHRICYNGIQSQLYNTVTDCPHREKLGWLDVPNMMFYSLSCNFDVKTLLSKVVMDAFDSQGTSGYVPSTVPHFMNVYDDDLNWGGAAITIPWRNYKQYGDKSLMLRYYDRMKRLITYYGTLANGGIIRNDYSVLSDWGQETSGLTNHTSSSFTLTCTYYYLLEVMAEVATVLGHDADAETWLGQAEMVKEAFNKRFFKDGVYEYGNQANYSMPLFYGMVDEENIEAVARALADAVKNSKYSIKTGEIGLRPTLMALAAHGYNDVVYRMVKKTTYPSYGYWVKQGATTSLEYWDMSLSQNHCMMDHIEEWFFSQLGGISNADEAYDSVNISPWIPADMAQANIAVQSPRGEVRMAWNRTESTTDYQINVPAGSIAKVTLPVVKGLRLYEKGTDISELPSVSNVQYADTLVCFTIGSGDYLFTMDGSTLTEAEEDNEDDDTEEDDEEGDIEGEEVTETYILNHGFEHRNTNAIPWAPTSWVLDFPDTNGNYGSISTSDQRNVNPTEGSYDWHIWYGGDYISVRLYQTISSLPQGSYRMLADMRCVDNAAITGRQRVFATVGSSVISERTIYSEPYNSDGSVNINNNDNENPRNWRTLGLDFLLETDNSVTIGFDCPRGETSSLGGFQVDNVRLFRLSNQGTGISPVIEEASACQEYYTLSGMRLKSLPERGFVIRKGNGKVSKLLLK